MNTAISTREDTEGKNKKLSYEMCVFSRIIILWYIVLSYRLYRIIISFISYYFIVYIVLSYRLYCIVVSLYRFIVSSSLHYRIVYIILLYLLHYCILRIALLYRLYIIKFFALVN